MRRFLLSCLATALFIGTLTIPTAPAHADTPVTISYGGTVIWIIPCISDEGFSIWTLELSARGVDPYVPEAYIWTDLTFATPPMIAIPAWHPGQQILGVATPENAFGCWTTTVPPTYWWGINEDTEGASPI